MTFLVIIIITTIPIDRKYQHLTKHQVTDFSLSPPPLRQKLLLNRTGCFQKIRVLTLYASYPFFLCHICYGKRWITYQGKMSRFSSFNVDFNLLVLSLLGIETLQKDEDEKRLLQSIFKLDVDTIILFFIFVSL
jgi:hypothetical protein